MELGVGRRIMQDKIIVMFFNIYEAEFSPTGNYAYNFQMRNDV